jgi:hypothetical protein
MAAAACGDEAVLGVAGGSPERRRPPPYAPAGREAAGANERAVPTVRIRLKRRGCDRRPRAHSRVGGSSAFRTAKSSGVWFRKIRALAA